MQSFASAPVFQDNTIAFPVDRINHTTQTLVEQTRQLFQHQGSDAELVRQITAAIDILNARCGDSHT
jgi:hypothetical protein